MHRINNLTELYNDSRTLYNNHVVGAESSADTILYNLEQGIASLKNSWKGMDAGVQINVVIGVYNNMVILRNALAELAVAATGVAKHYRDIQIGNRGTSEEFSVLTYEAKSKLEEYSDVADTINITVDAVKGKDFIDSACGLFDQFTANVKTNYSDIMNNWQEGPGRDVADSDFNTFLTNVNNYKQLLSDASTNITTALSNYGLL